MGKKTQTRTNTGTHGQTLTDTITNPHASGKGGRGLLFRNLQETLAYRQVRNLIQAVTLAAELVD